jgi:hypothetical protein
MEEALMLAERLTDPEFVVLELIDGLGGEAHSAHLCGLIRSSLKSRCKPILIDLFDRGLLVRYAPGHYALTPEGREALAQARSCVEVSWLE